MPRSAPLISSFNAGEFSPLMVGRSDIKYYANACRRIRNFIPLRQGPARRRAGTRFIAAVKASANRTWLGRFIFNTSQAYVLEFGNLYIRFFADQGVVGAPFEVTTPYTTANLISDSGTFNLRYVQSGDVQYICHSSYQQRKLTRTGAATFSIAALETQGGPFKDIEPAQTVTVYASAATGSGITLTASSVSTFLAGHVGTLFLVEQRNVDDVTQWESGKSITAGDRRRSDGKNYVALNTATTGTIKPTHTVGAKYDGDAGVQWEFSDPGYGWVRITAIGGGGATATADVVSTLPYGCVGSGQATTRWAHSAWSDVEGWPTNATFYKERLVFSRGQFAWLSVAGDFENFRSRDDGGLVTADSAIRIDITSDQANEIVWMSPTDMDLQIGTVGDEQAIGAIARGEPFGPGNINARKQAEYGSAYIPALRVGDGVLYVQRSGRKVRDSMFSWEKEGFKTTDVTILADHIAKGGIADAAYQQEPDSVAWFPRNDGILLGFTVDREQDVRGWHTHRIGGYSNSAQSQFAVVEAVTSIPHPDGEHDDLWMIVRRYINGGTVRYVEVMEAATEEGDDQEDAFYVDSGLTLNNTVAQTLTPGTGADVEDSTGVIFTAGGAVFSAGDVGRFIHYRYYTVNIKGEKVWDKAVVEITGYTSTTVVTGTVQRPFPDLSVIASGGWRMTVTTISGLGHLIGQTVQILGDGAVQVDKVVNGSGQITVDHPVSKAQVGLGCPAVLQPMPIESGSADGTASGKLKRAHSVVIRFDQSLGCKYGRDEDLTLDEIPFRSTDDDLDFMLPLFTGDKEVLWPDGYDGQLLLTIVQEQPLPCTIVSIAPRMNTEDR